MKNTFSASEIVSVLQGEGYRALYEHDGIDNAYISSGSQGNFWEINIGDTQDDEQMGNVVITYLMSVNPVQFPVGKICNDYNRATRFGTASYNFDDDLDFEDGAFIRLDLGISFDGGVSDDWLINQIRMWDVCVEIFIDTTHENEEPVSDDASL
jgi:hypothetical protein